MRSNLNLGSILPEVMDELASKSKHSIYQNDFLAWASDVLGRSYYSKMAEIADEIAHARTGRTRTAVKSSNGAGKSFLLSDVGTWWVTAFPPEESLAIFSATGRDQIERVVFRYLKDNYGYMKTNGHAPRGSINESLEWKFDKIDGSGKEVVAFGKRPADTDIVSSFQGTRKRRTFVGFDEMGGLPQDLFTAAEAVTTGGDTRFVGIGNPDRRNTPFHSLFTNANFGEDWNLYTISAYELPTLTGEIVYEDPVKQEAMMTSGMTDRVWVEHKERAWRTLQADGSWKPNALFKAKVLGQFPDEDDSTFFPEPDIVNAQEVQIEPETDAPIWVGFDPAFEGEDESIVMVNQGGRVRLFSENIAYRDEAGEIVGRTTGAWDKSDAVDNARRIHAICNHIGADELRIDVSGAGSGVLSVMNRYPEFADGNYDLYEVKGGVRSDDRFRWSLKRDQHHDNLRELLHDGLIDIDPDDQKLKDELMIVTYELNDKGAVKITPKRKLRNQFGGSPDRLDALIYSVIDASHEAALEAPSSREYHLPEEFADVSDLYTSAYGA